MAKGRVADTERGQLEEIVVTGEGFTFAGRGRVVRVTAREEGAEERKGRKAPRDTRRTPRLKETAVGILADAGLSSWEISFLLGIPRRTLSDIRRRLKKERQAEAVRVAAEAGRRQEAKEAEQRTKEERERQECEAVASAVKEYERLPMAAPLKRRPEMGAEDGVNLARLNKSFQRFGQAE